ncbi:unnamed protein product [Polarella glacialis]|uniref:Uncharacterized protein n=1 Tax=Polarella glacialis TaxID=89957 RepID=A0A813GAB8_POLGL|nr:unnamed protein product [Polarella glacialis]
MNIISMTMSIFTAVLMYQGINQILAIFIESLNEWYRCLIQFGHCSIYIICMQLVIGNIAGMIGEGGGTESLDESRWTIADGLRADFGRELDPVEVEQVRNKTGIRSVWIDSYAVEVPVMKIKVELQGRKRRMRCWGMLLAHMSGFAAISAGGELQHTELFSSSPYMTLIPVVITQAVVQIFFGISHMFRRSIMKEAIRQGGKGRRVLLCHENVVEAENDVSSLSMSFLTAQAIRFFISGVFPNIEGLEAEPEMPKTNSVIMEFLIDVSNIRIVRHRIGALVRAGTKAIRTIIQVANSISAASGSPLLPAGDHKEIAREGTRSATEGEEVLAIPSRWFPAHKVGKLRVDCW